MKDFEFLKRLSMADGIPGNEDEVREILKHELKDDVDEFKYDKLGSLIAVKKGEESGLNIGIFAHMDEVGFIVKEIDKDGFLKVYPLGSIDAKIMSSLKVTVTNRFREKFIGVLTSDKKGQDIEIDNLYVDLGVKDRKEIESLNIREGDMITPYENIEILRNNNILGKAFDDRLGCAICTRVLKEIDEKEHNLYGAFTVQEEAGVRGGKTSVEIVKPDLAIVVDIASSKETPGLRQKGGRRISKGPCVVYLNKMAILNRKLYNYVVDIAKEEEIDIQFDILNGGTDSGPVHLYKDGVKTIEIIIPIRNAHSNVSIFNYDDYEKGIKLIKAIIKNIDRETLEKMI